ncbi:MAG TPA: hypothetical protein VHP33_11675 [Polyangiaceae bacterium]|nr:hypothetical protein [Polyangiaceae bacterium]
MKSSLRVGLGLIAVSSLFAFVACGDDDDSPTPAAHAGSGGEGAAAHGGEGAAVHGGEGHGGAASLALECKVLGTLCHEADTGSGTGHDCHEVGHEGHVDECAEQFDSCIAFCTAEEGAGGAGGAPVEAKDAHCAALGELCHAVDDENGPLHECHELGHVGNAAKCAAGFDECATLCLAAREALPHTPAGGAGGTAGAGGASAGGASLGGAGGAQ